MQKYLFSKVMIFAFAAFALSASPTTETSWKELSMRQKLAEIGGLCAVASNDFCIGFASGAAGTLFWSKVLQASEKKINSNFIPVISGPVVITSLGVASGMTVILEELEEKIAPKTMSQVAQLDYDNFKFVTRMIGMYAGAQFTKSLTNNNKNN